MSEFYKKAYMRGALESWNLYINDTENENGLSIKSGSTIGTDSSSDTSEAYVEMKKILAINKESKNSRLLVRSRFFNSTINKIVPSSKSKYSYCARTNLSNPKLNKNFPYLGSFQSKNSRNFEKIEEGCLIIKSIQAIKNNHKKRNSLIFLIKKSNSSHFINSY
jgi:hypothetical protein